MKFAYPEFLYALSAIAIPIIIHLFNFRKFKKIYFSNVEFLKEVQQETQSRSKLKHLLILTSRILAITFLVLAFAQPFIPIEDAAVKSQEQVTGIYIDNSFSMESTGAEGSLLSEAKNKAIEIVKAHRATDRFVLLTNDFSAANQRLLSNEEIIDKIENVQISAVSRHLSEVYSRMRDALNAANIEQKSCYLNSDFQKSSSDIGAIKSDSTIATFMLPVRASQVNNLYVDSCWFESPTHLYGQNEALFVRIQNNADVDLEKIPLKLFINNKSITPASFSVKAQNSVVVQLNYRNKSTGIQQGRIEIRDRPVSFDDHFFFSYSITAQINVLSIGDDFVERKLRAVYETDSIFNYTHSSIDQLDYSLIAKSDLVILAHATKVSSGLAASLNKYIQAGGSLHLIPSSKIDIDGYREFMSLIGINYFTDSDTSSTKVKSIQFEHPLYRMVFEGKPDGNLNLPLVKQHYTLSQSSTAFKNVVLSLRNGAPFLVHYEVQQGHVYVNTTSLEKELGNYANHAIFVPTLYNMALLSQKASPLYFVIGSNETIEVDPSDKDLVYHIIGKDIDLIPQSRNNANSTTIFVSNGINKATNYTLTGEDMELGLAFNYNRIESDLSCYSAEELSEAVSLSGIHANLIEQAGSEIKGALNELNIGKKYWKYCIILALVFLAIEVVLIKLFK